MTRLCERPGCSEPGAVSYGVDAANRTVTLSVPKHGDEDPRGVLCRRHADSMVVPLGWTLDDRREAVPRLFRVPHTEPEHMANGAHRRPPRPARDDPPSLFDGEPPTVDVAIETAVETATVAALSGTESTSPDETVAIAWNPQFDTADDLDGLLAAETELLSRAFGRSRRPRRR